MCLVSVLVAEELVTKLSTFKRDVVGAPLWVCFKALLAGSPPPRSYYVVPYRPSENMYIVPSDDTVVVVHSICFENHVEQAIARVFLQVRAFCFPDARTRAPRGLHAACEAHAWLDVSFKHLQASRSARWAAGVLAGQQGCSLATCAHVVPLCAPVRHRKSSSPVGNHVI